MHARRQGQRASHQRFAQKKPPESRGFRKQVRSCRCPPLDNVGHYGVGRDFLQHGIRIGSPSIAEPYSDCPSASADRQTSVPWKCSLWGCRTQPIATSFLVFFSKTPPGPRSGRTGATAAEHPCPAGQAGLTALRRTTWSGSRAARLSASVSGPPDRRAGIFSPPYFSSPMPAALNSAYFDVI